MIDSSRVRPRSVMVKQPIEGRWHHLVAVVHTADIRESDPLRFEACPFGPMRCCQCREADERNQREERQRERRAQLRQFFFGDQS